MTLKFVSLEVVQVVGSTRGWATGVIFDVFLAGFTKEKPTGGRD